MNNRRQSMSKRSPSILVTDSRHGAHSTAPFVRTGGFARDKRGQQSQQQQARNGGRNSPYPNTQGSGSSSTNNSGRFDSISIDNILSDVSEIPSAQRRTPDLHQLSTHQQPSVSSSRAQRNSSSNVGYSTMNKPSGAKRTGAKGSAGNAVLGRLPPRLTPTMMQGRTTKQSEKLVLIPEEGKPNFKFEDDDELEGEDHPPRAKGTEPEDDLSGRRRSYAERLPKDRRTDQFGRVTAYCVSDAIRLKAAAEYLREKHKIRPRVYDEALFAPYYMPLLPGDEDSRVKSSPQGLANMERLIIESEQGDHHYEYFSGLDESSDNEQQVEVHDLHDGWTAEGEEFDPSEPQAFSPPTKTSEWPEENESSQEQTDPERVPSPPLAPQEEEIAEIVKQDDVPKLEPPPNDKHAEMFIFAYGIVVFWNFNERQEKDVLADLMFARSGHNVKGSSESVMLKPLVIRPVDDSDIETEELHFIYSPDTNRPRIYNDMITLKSGDHMIKMAMSHAIAQSTKLSRFEARMDVNMHDVKHVPKMLALTGKLGMKREEVLKISGKLFKLRVDVNLSSNVLDTPEFFWEDEPSLNPLYTAVREYLELEQRILVLNERCKVFLELTDIIADSIAEGNMSRITWIIIILIALSLGVSMLEIFIRYTILGARE